jgi:hypothetical protein
MIAVDAQNVKAEKNCIRAERREEFTRAIIAEGK